MSENHETDHTKILLIEQNQEYTNKALDRIEKKIDNIDKKIQRVEKNIYTNIKWIIGLGVSIILSISSIITETYQFLKS